MWLQSPVRQTCNPSGRKLMMPAASLKVASRGDAHDEKDSELSGPEQRALRRKSGLSPLKGHMRTGRPPILPPNGETTVAESPTVEPTRTGFKSVGASGQEKSTTTGGIQEGAASGLGEVPKRKRIAADERARLSASDLNADSASGGGKKRRRTAVTKTVRFDIDGCLKSSEEGKEGSDGDINSADTGGFDNLLEKEKETAGTEDVNKPARIGSSNGQAMGPTTVRLTSAEAEQPVLPPVKARVRGGQIKARKVKIDRRKTIATGQPPTGLSEEKDENRHVPPQSADTGLRTE